MPDKFNIRFDLRNYRFEEEFGVFGLLQSPDDPIWRRGLLDTGATISIIDLNLARKVGGILQGVSGVTGIGGNKLLVYVVKVGLHVKHKEKDGPEMNYKKIVQIPALPYLEKGYQEEVLLILFKNKPPLYLFPDLLFAEMPMKKIMSEAEKDSAGNPKIQKVKISLDGIGMPLLIGCDVMSQLQEEGFKMDFDFQNRLVQKVILF
jgi:hypothetical protein